MIMKNLEIFTIVFRDSVKSWKSREFQDFEILRFHNNAKEHHKYFTKNTQHYEIS